MIITQHSILFVELIVFLLEISSYFSQSIGSNSISLLYAQYIPECICMNSVYQHRFHILLLSNFRQVVRTESK